MSSWKRFISQTSMTSVFWNPSNWGKNWATLCRNRCISLQRKLKKTGYSARHLRLKWPHDTLKYSRKQPILSGQSLLNPVFRRIFVQYIVCELVSLRRDLMDPAGNGHISQQHPDFHVLSGFLHPSLLHIMPGYAST